MTAAEKFSTELGTAPACRAFGVARASLYRRRQRGAAPGAERGPPTVTSGIECRRAASRPRPAA